MNKVGEGDTVLSPEGVNDLLIMWSCTCCLLVVILLLIKVLTDREERKRLENRERLSIEVE